MSDDKKDLTRIEDLSEFLHDDDDTELEDFQSTHEAFGAEVSSADNTDPDIASSLEESTLSSDETSEFSTDFSQDSTEEFSSNDDFNSDFNTDSFSDETEPEEFNTEFSSDETSSFEMNDDFSTDSFDNDDDVDTQFETNEESFSDDFNSDFSSQDSQDSMDNELDNEVSSEEDNLTDTSEFNDDQFASDELESDEFSDDSMPEMPQEDNNADEFAASPPSTEELNHTKTTLESKPVENIPNIENVEQTPSSSSVESKPPTSNNVNSEKIKINSDLSDVSGFAQNIRSGDFTTEGNPPFTVILKGLKYIEDKQQILDMLKTIGFLSDANKADIESSLDRGHLIISRVSEYCALFLCHKLRHFNVDLDMGLSDIIQPPKSYEANNQVQLTKRSLNQNITTSMNFDASNLNIEDILVTTTNQMEGYEIEAYKGIISESIIAHTQNDEELELEKESILSLPGQPIVVTQTDHNELGLSRYFHQLISKLKAKALAKGGNCVLGLNFQTIPKSVKENKKEVEILALANVAWVEKYTIKND